MKFSTFNASIHGKKYLERGLPCQDSSSVLEFDGVQAIALADGHGGKDYFRSETGSKLAVETAFNQIKIFCNDISEDEIFSESGIRNFEFKIWEEWLLAVKNHWRENPVDENEPRWQDVSDKYKARYASDEKYIPVAYGTTLICALSIGSQVLIVQIGDGSCVVLQRDGEFKMPVPPDAESFANVTASLCDEDAYKKFRHVVLDFNVAVSENLGSCAKVFDSNAESIFRGVGLSQENLSALDENLGRLCTVRIERVEVPVEKST